MRSINSSMGKKFKCEKCNEQFSTKRALNQHVNELCSDAARKKKGYDCEHCGAGPFKVKGTLQHTTKNVNKKTEEIQWRVQFVGKKLVHFV